MTYTNTNTDEYRVATEAAQEIFSASIWMLKEQGEINEAERIVLARMVYFPSQKDLANAAKVLDRIKREVQYSTSWLGGLIELCYWHSSISSCGEHDREAEELFFGGRSSVRSFDRTLLDSMAEVIKASASLQLELKPGVRKRLAGRSAAEVEADKEASIAMAGAEGRARAGESQRFSNAARGLPGA